MQRFFIIAAGALIAAFAIWHPAPRAAGIASVAAAAPRKRLEMPLPSVAPAMVVVYVAGRVAHPGLYRLPPGKRADDAVRAAGGVLPDADPVAVNLAAPLADGDEIAVPAVGDTVRRSTVRTARSRKARRSSRASAAPIVVDVNAAGGDELGDVPGIGPAVAARIVAVRAQEGPFTSLDQLLDVSGMTPAKLDRAAPYLTVGR